MHMPMILPAVAIGVGATGGLRRSGMSFWTRVAILPVVIVGVLLAIQNFLIPVLTPMIEDLLAPIAAYLPSAQLRSYHRIEAGMEWTFSDGFALPSSFSTGNMYAHMTRTSSMDIQWMESAGAFFL